jgi:hypothetical protein
LKFSPSVNLDSTKEQRQRVEEKHWDGILPYFLNSPPLLPGKHCNDLGKLFVFIRRFGSLTEPLFVYSIKPEPESNYDTSSVMHHCQTTCGVFTGREQYLCERDCLFSQPTEDGANEKAYVLYINSD